MSDQAETTEPGLTGPAAQSLGDELHAEIAAIDSAALELQEQLGPLDASAALFAALSEKHADDITWLPEWYLQKLVEIEAARQAIEEHTDRLLRQCAAREKALAWKWGRQVNQVVDGLLRQQHGTKKSVQFATGRAGYRTTGGAEKIVVDDESKALAHAAKMCPDAIVTTRRLRIKELEDFLCSVGELVPGTHVETTPREDRFYIGRQMLHKWDTAELPTADSPAPSARADAKAFLAGTEGTERTEPEPST